MRPYYQDEHVTLYHADSLERPGLWTGSDVLITDPPYGTHTIGDAEGGYGRRGSSPAGEFQRKSPKDRIGAVIAGDQSTASRDEALSLWGSKPALIFGSPRMPEPPGEWSDRLVWDKKRPGMNGGPWRYRHESIFVSSGFIRTSNASVSILTVWPDQSDHIHAKPVELMTALIEPAPPGVIADPFAGSGSTLVAAKRLGRKAIGVELEEHYCEIAAKRLAQDVLDLGM